MNDAHLALCSSPEWAEVVAQELLPWLLESRDPGGSLLELGPGPGLTTDALRGVVENLTCLELDGRLGAALAKRIPDVEVVVGDASAMPFAANRFDAVATFTMLHHIPREDLQDRVLSESHRVLRPGGLLVGADSLDTPDRRLLHEDDVFVPLEPTSLAARIRRAGFDGVAVEVRGERILFAAHAGG